MKIDLPTGGFIMIDDNNPDAIKIRQGYTYTIVNDQIVIGAKTGLDRDAIKAKLLDESATITDIKKIILYILNRLED